MFRRNLAIKLIFFIAAILILTIGIFVYININIQKKYLIGEMQQDAVRLSLTIERSIKYDMLTARSDFIQRTLEDIGELEGIEHIRILDKKGKIIAADSAEEIGELGKSFDRMTTELKKSREEIEKWNVKLKNEVTRATEKLRKTNKELNRANKRLHELDNVKSDFMRRMEHGSRSHLAVIQSCLSLVLKEYSSELNEQQKDLVTTAELRCSTMLDLLDDILILSYRKSTEAVYHLKPVQVTHTVQKVVEEIHDQAQKNNIKIDVQIPADFPPMLADPEALREVLTNLLNNAVKYTKEHRTVNVSAQQKKGFLQIEVQDTGIGIASEDLKEIFQEFYRAPNAKSHKVEGTGLGLAIVKVIVEALHGRVDVQSELGKGSTFTVILPKA